MAHKSLVDPRNHYPLQLGARGRLVLPAAVRKRFDLQPGDSLVLTIEPSGALRLVSLRKQLAKVRGMLKCISPERVLSAELLQERRREARRERRA